MQSVLGSIVSLLPCGHQRESLIQQMQHLPCASPRVHACSAHIPAPSSGSKLRSTLSHTHLAPLLQPHGHFRFLQHNSEAHCSLRAFAHAVPCAQSTFPDRSQLLLTFLRSLLKCDRREAPQLPSPAVTHALLLWCLVFFHHVFNT